MKLTELRPCDNCGGPIAPTFYVVSIDQALVHPKAANEVLGLNQMFGGHALQLAEVMAPDAEAVKMVPGGPTKIYLCIACCCTAGILLAALLEKRHVPPPAGGNEETPGLPLEEEPAT
jgi:hypothetical protein